MGPYRSYPFDIGSAAKPGSAAVELARLAREAGAVAASAFGAGFGGSVWALVPTPVRPPLRWGNDDDGI